MALQSSGAISLQDIADEFGGTVPHEISEYTQHLVTTVTSQTYTQGMRYKKRNSPNTSNPTNGTSFDNLFTATPASEGIWSGTINWTQTSNRPTSISQTSTGYSWEVETELYQATAGTYTFRVASDDGCRLTINGTMVAFNYGPSGITDNVKVVNVNLTQGYNTFKFQMQQGAGGHGAKIEWKPSTANNNSYVVIPASAYQYVTTTTTESSQSAPYSLSDFYGLSSSLDILFKASTHNTVNAGGSITVNLPSGSAVGDFVLMVVVMDERDANPWTLNRTGWTAIHNVDNFNDYPETACWGKVLTSTDISDGDITLTDSDPSSDGIVAATYGFRGDGTTISSLTAHDVTTEAGPSALSSDTISISSASTHPVLAIGYASGRPLTQNPTESGTLVTNGTKISHSVLDLYYEIFNAGDTLTDRTFSTNDAGRQCKVEFYITFT